MTIAPRLWARSSQALLACSAAISLGVGTALAFFPVQFRASFGVASEHDAGALSEIRAPGGALIALGLLMLLGCASKAHRATGLRVASATFLGYGLARAVGFAIDGAPSADLLQAAAVELSFGAAAAVALAIEARTGAP